MSALTKADLDAALTGFRDDIVSALSDLGKKVAKLEQKVDKLEQKVDKLEQKVDKLEQKVDANKDELMEFARQIETNLLTEFHRYGKGQQVRLHSVETSDARIIERLAIIEERLLHLESRRPPTV
jgi:chromosome segregation ATPase